jgi:Flp pilus assembly protein CpaB
MARVMTTGRLIQPARRLDIRVLTGLLLLLATLAGGALFWQSLDRTRAVLVYARDVPAGALIQSSDLTSVSFAVPAALRDTVVPVAERDQIIGRVAGEDLHAGGLVQRASLSGRPAVPPGGGIVALPVSATSAVGGRLQIGDHVRVVATWNRARDHARTETVLPDALIEDVGRAPATDLGASVDGGPVDSAISYVSVIVNDSAEMERVVAAKENAALDLIWLAPPSRPASRTTPTS